MPETPQVSLIGLSRCYNPIEIGQRRVLCVCFFIEGLEPMSPVTWAVRFTRDSTGEAVHDFGELDDVVQSDGNAFVALRIPAFTIDAKGHKCWIDCDGVPLGHASWGPCPF